MVGVFILSIFVSKIKNMTSNQFKNIITEIRNGITHSIIEKNRYEIISEWNITDIDRCIISVDDSGIRSRNTITGRLEIERYDDVSTSTLLRILEVIEETEAK